MLQLSLGKRVVITMCHAESRGAQRRLPSFAQCLTLKVRLYDAQVSALSELALGRQSKLIPPRLREGVFSVSGEKANHLNSC